MSFQTRHVGASSISDLVATHQVNLSGNCMPLPQEGVWSGFIQQTSIAFIQHSHDFTQCIFPTLQEHDVQGEPDALALKFQLFFWV